MPMREDLGAFLAVDDFAVTVRSESPDRTFTAIFDNAGAELKLGGMRLETTTPELGTTAANVEGFVRGETLVHVEGVAEPFTVARVVPDGTGWARVELAP